MRKNGNGNPHRRKKGRRTFTLWELWAKQDGRCKYCNCAIIVGGGGMNAATRDHVVPRARGGKRANNQVAACRDCNQWKGPSPLRHFLAKLEA